MDNTKNIVNAKMKESEGKKLAFTLGPSVVTTDKLHDSAVTPEKVNPNTFELIQSMIDKRGDDLQNQIDGIDKHGIAVSNQLGDDPYISVSQQYLTQCFNEIWDKIDEITGEQSRGVVMTVTPEYFISETGADIHINAVPVYATGIFEHIALYKNDDEEPFVEADKVSSFDYDLYVEDDTLIICKAKIMGITYIQEQTIKHYNSFWLGAGNTYQDVMIPENLIPIENEMRGAYDITVAQDNQRFYVILGKSLSGFIRIDMNGFEIPMTKMPDSTLEAYNIYVSDNAYQAGTYNIDVNG
jgi:hypothetical protein